MPSPRIKTKSSMGSLREKNSLRVCQKSSMICKRPCCHVRVSQQGAEFNTCFQIQNCHDGGLTENDFILAAKINALDLHHLLRKKVTA